VTENFNEIAMIEDSLVKALRVMLQEQQIEGAVSSSSRDGPIVTVLQIEGAPPLRFVGGLVKMLPESRALWAPWLTDLVILQRGSVRQVA